MKNIKERLIAIGTGLEPAPNGFQNYFFCLSISMPRADFAPLSLMRFCVHVPLGRLSTRHGSTFHYPIMENLSVRFQVGIVFQSAMGLCESQDAHYSLVRGVSPYYYLITNNILWIEL
jgi:hypothetical protein